MSILHAVVLGILQGLSEFLPISSSAHLIGFPWLLGWNDFGDDESLKRAFDVALHLGTLMSLIYYLRSEIIELFIARKLPAKRSTASKLPAKRLQFIFLIFLTSIPAALVGALLFEEASTENIWLIATLLITFGFLLAVGDLWGGNQKTESDLNWREAGLLGVMQIAALWPGVSRSGIIITSGRVRGFNRPAIVNISFWMAIPIIAGAGLYKFIDIGGVSGIPANMRPAFLVGMATSALVGFMAIKLLTRLVARVSFLPLVMERILLGLLMLILLATSFR